MFSISFSHRVSECHIKVNMYRFSSWDPMFVKLTDLIEIYVQIMRDFQNSKGINEIREKQNKKKQNNFVYNVILFYCLIKTIA